MLEVLMCPFWLVVYTGCKDAPDGQPCISDVSGQKVGRGMYRNAESGEECDLATAHCK